jgi:hypothetical protein
LSRFYKIDINNGQYVFTNQVNGKLDSGALRVELQLEATSYATPTGQSSVILWGVPLVENAGKSGNKQKGGGSGNIPGISQASDLNNLDIEISGGMQDGLPFATQNVADHQQGILTKGYILQAYGNWMDVNQSIGLVVSSGINTTQADPANIVISWKKGQKLADALEQTFKTAYPNLKPDIKISDNLVLPSDEATQFDTVQAMAPWVKQISKQIIGATYPGVDMWISNGVIKIFDYGTNGDSPVPIKFVDMMGQPTWLSSTEISFATVMRADIDIGTYIKLPELSAQQSVTTPQSDSQYRNKSAFKGTWQVSQIRHVGDSRAASALSWVTIYQAYSNQPPEDTSFTSPPAS